MIYVRPLLSIDFDIHEEFVHHCSCFSVLETFMRHDVAPMAGRISNGEKNGLSQRASVSQCLSAPNPPMDGIIGVLQQVGTGGSMKLVA
jgi:hypothetical protein